ncbi:MAG: hypothetical protein OEY96_12345 [Gammaproteobacteria bacterium]|nr:hypothetical protein [Gammaproteobacteria bacterium]
MTISYHYNYNSNVVNTLVSGKLTCEQLGTHFEKLLQDKSLLSNYIEVVDLNLATDFEASFTAMQQLALDARRLMTSGHQVSIFLAFNKNSRDILSMMSYLFQKLPLTICLCQSVEEARENLAIISNNMNTPELACIV